MNRKVGVIYGLYCVCPRCESECKIRYVGLTTQKPQRRLQSHLSPRTSYVTVVYSWVHRHGSSNIRMKLLETDVNYSDLERREKHWISAMETYVGESEHGLNSTLSGPLPGVVERSTEVARNPLEVTYEEACDVRRRFRATVLTPKNLAQEYGLRVSDVKSILKNEIHHDPEYLYDSSLRRDRSLTGNKNGSKLNWSLVDRSRELWLKGWNLNDIVSQIGAPVKPETIRLVVTNKTWADATYDPSQRDRVVPTRGTKPGVRVSEAVRSQVRELKSRGLTHLEISKIVALSQTTISGICSDLSLASGTRRGSRNGQAQLDEEKVRGIKKLLSLGVSGARVAEMFGTTPQNVSRIKNGKSWSHVREGLE